MHRNIFDGLVRNENTLTELLCNLSKYLGFRRVLTEGINAALGLECLVYGPDEITSQERDPSAGQPDIRIDSSDTLILIECKVDNCGLTSKQIEEYPKLIGSSKKKHSGLLFLVPEDYQHIDIIQDIIERHKGQAGFISISTWNNLIARLCYYGLAETNDIFKDFLDLLGQWFEPISIDFTKGELDMLFNKEVGKSYSALIDLVDSIYEIVAKTYSCSRSRISDEYGLYVKDNKGSQILWFGIYYAYWEATGYPLCIGLLKNKQKPASIPDSIIENTIEDNFWNYYSVEKELLIAKENTKTLSGILMSLIEYKPKSSR